MEVSDPTSDLDVEVEKFLVYNWTINVTESGFFGFALGFGSFITILPLFVSTMTKSPILIGLIPAIHTVGWQLPELLIANHVSRLKRYKPLVLIMTIHERLPYLGLAFIAFYLPSIGLKLGLILTFLMLIWQGLGAGLTATPWQSMISKLIPSLKRGTFFGFQSSAANLLASISAVIAGIILEKVNNTTNFGICFLCAFLIMQISFFILSHTREPESRLVQPVSTHPTTVWSNIAPILRKDKNFRWFLVARTFCQLAIMTISFYTVYAVQFHHVNDFQIGLMTGTYMATQIFANPFMGWIGDRWSHRLVMEIGIIAVFFSAVLAAWAPSPNWFFLVFLLSGIGNVAVWTIGLTMGLQFGTAAEKPTYIGLANTLIAPTSIIAPFLAGWLADKSGYPAAFLVSAVAAFLTVIVLQFGLADPQNSS